MASPATALRRRWYPWLTVAAVVHLTIAAGMFWLAWFGAVGLLRSEGPVHLMSLPFTWGGMLIGGGGGIGVVSLVGVFGLARRRCWGRWLLMLLSTVWLVPAIGIALTFNVAVSHGPKQAIAEVLLAIGLVIPLTVVSLPQVGRELRA